MTKLHKSHSKGAWCEYLAAHYYLEKGYNVYWPAVQQGSADFIVERGRRLDRIQVKKASWQGTPTRTGNKYLQVVTTNNDKEYSDQYDYLVVIDE